MCPTGVQCSFPWERMMEGTLRSQAHKSATDIVRSEKYKKKRQTEKYE